MKNRCLFAAAKRIQKTHFTRIVVVSVLTVSTAIACGWSYWTDHSVRFNSMRTGRGFHRLPPLPLRYDPVTGKEQTASEFIDENNWSEDSYESEEPAKARPAVAWEEAREAVERNDLSGLRKRLSEYLDATKYAFTDDSTTSQQARRNTAVDILDVLNEMRNGASTEAVLSYVTTRFTPPNVGTDGELPLLSSDNEKRMSALRSMRDQDRLRLEDNWQYLRAATLYNSGQKPDALNAFRLHIREFPQSEKHESANYMIGRILLEMSHATLTENCGIEGFSMWGEQVDPVKIESPEKCRDGYWREAMDHFKTMANRFPNGRYRNDVRGWIAFLHKRGDERPEALAEYYRLLGQTQDAQWRLEAKKSLQIIGHGYDDKTLDRVEALIADEPDAALAYAYHRIYNHAVDASHEEFDKWCCSGETRWSDIAEEKQRVNKERDKGRHELERIGKFASEMVQRYGSSRVSGDFLLRVAQAKIELENFPDAISFANKALDHGVEGDSRAQALWVKGSVEHQQKKYSAARTTFSALIKEYPDHQLIEGTRRLLAITAEDQDDLEFALDQYLALKYEYDVAYYVDILLPTERLSGYVADRPHSAHRDYLLYALATRLMRDRKWGEARTTLLQIKTEVGTRERDGFEKEPDYWSYQSDAVIKTEWVTRDLQTIDDLKRLEIAVEGAIDDEEKAEAMYQLASYQYDADPLLFYNPAAWQGMRHMLLSEFADGDNMRLPGETFNILESSRSHETYARAIPIYLDIVDGFPNTKVAKDALYSAVIAHERLGNLNPYWREIYGNGFFAGPRIVTNADINRMFPKFRWPRSRLGWVPSSRTVRGGPTYEPLPKPPPRPTTGQRVTRKLGKWAGEYGPTVGKNVATAKDGIKDVALYVSGAIAGYLQNYYYLVFTGFLATIFWANRKKIYEGPVTKGSFLAHRGLVFLGKCIQDRLAAIAVSSIIRIKPDVPSNSGTTSEE